MADRVVKKPVSQHTQPGRFGRKVSFCKLTGNAKSYHGRNSYRSRAKPSFLSSAIDNRFKLYGGISAANVKSPDPLRAIHLVA